VIVTHSGIDIMSSWIRVNGRFDPMFTVNFKVLISM
jgi:hypothetical protein